MATEHVLKTWPEHFEAVIDQDLSKRKSVEIRKNDRNFAVGDTLLLYEFDPESGRYTGRFEPRQITHILRGGPWLPEGYVALSIRELPSVKDQQDKLAALLDGDCVDYIRQRDGGVDFYSDEDKQYAERLAKQKGLHLLFP